MPCRRPWRSGQARKMMNSFSAGGFSFHPVRGPDGEYVEQRDLWGQRRALIEVRATTHARRYCERGRPIQDQVRLVPMEEWAQMEPLLEPV